MDRQTVGRLAQAGAGERAERVASRSVDRGPGVFAPARVRLKPGALRGAAHSLHGAHCARVLGLGSSDEGEAH